MLINRKKILNILLITMIFISSELAAAPVTRLFGSTPYNDVIASATAAIKCTGLTSNELAVMMLVVSWHETAGGGTAATPSPMTLSRYDYGVGNEWLYSNGTYAGDQRAFSHPGIGLWQMDDAGEGKFFAAHERIDTAISSRATATKIAYEYCRQSGTDANKRRLAWGDGWGGWYACRGSNLSLCETAYQNHYKATGDAVINVTLDNTVGRLGGMVIQNCALPSDKLGFTCYYINPQNAQGHKGNFWQQAPLVGGSNGTKPSPLAFSFYNYWLNGHEYRHWIKEDTAYQTEVSVFRPSGQNSRAQNVWHNDNILCQGIKLITFIPIRGTCNYL